MYNTVLRRFPSNIYQVLQSAQNLYSSTLFALASAVTKISRVEELGSTRLYRSLGGYLEFPKSFYVEDHRGYRGFTELSFISTTSNRDVALQHSGARGVAPRPTIVEILTTATCGGACIRDLSQYPREVEYVFPPCCFVEPYLDPRVEATNLGFITVMPAKIISNAKTVDEVMEWRKDAHVEAFRYFLLKLLVAVDQQKEDANFQMASGSLKENYASQCSQIIEECKQIYSRHSAVPSCDYCKDETYQHLLVEMLQTQRLAITSVEAYLSEFLPTGKRSVSLRDLYRSILNQLRKTASESVQEEQAHAFSCRFCKLKGLFCVSVDECDEYGETPLIRAAANGLCTEDVTLLIVARSNVNSPRSTVRYMRMAKFFIFMN